MIEILLKEIPFEQDIRALLMAFYPGEEYRYEIESNKVEKKLCIIGEEKEGYYHFKIIFFTYSREFKVLSQGERIEIKNQIKRKLYQILSVENNCTLPWGTLTGIRPTKIAMQELLLGKRVSEIVRDLQEKYFVSQEKAKLCTYTAQTEKDILKKIDYQEGWSLYIGIPFCPTRCAYCSFTAYPISVWEKQNKTEVYIEALCKEIYQVAKLMQYKKLQTIYIGGGTPTSLTALELDKILGYLQKQFNLQDILEFTVEAGRPDSITRDKLQVLKKYKVDRISINPQTMKQKTLDIIGRKHTVEKVREEFQVARELGFQNINMDLIMGLPGESPEDIKYTMEEIAKLKPDALTIHSLALKRAARLTTEKEKYLHLQIQNTWEMLEQASEICRQMGLQPYYLYRQKNMAGNFENVGYAKPGKECIYNILIMEEKQTIMACGAGTTTKLVYPLENRVERVENVKDPKLYIERLEEMIDRKYKMYRI